MYELIVRRFLGINKIYNKYNNDYIKKIFFLACCSKDAEGDETKVDIDIQNEKFYSKGLAIKEKNYLEIYKYDRWSENEVPYFEVGNVFQPSEVIL